MKLLPLIVAAVMTPFMFTVLPSPAADAAVRKTEDIVIYRNDQFHCAFPSVVRLQNGELLLAFRCAPDRRVFGEKGNNHTDPNSHLVMVRSKDDGRTWSQEPELLFAHPFGGSQDPCLIRLSDDSIVCASYGWALLRPDGLDRLKKPALQHGGFVFLGGYLLRSSDGGRSWQGPVVPPHCPGDATHDAFGRPTPAYNRGALCEGRDGRLHWVVAANRSDSPRRSETHLMTSADKRLTWQYACPVAKDDTVNFNETSLYETPKGDLVAFMRTADFDDHTCVARSTDGGRSFQKWRDAGFQGHPHHALRLPDQRVLLVYGYRHKPFGIRARILDPECTAPENAPEIVLRDDGGGGDIGYPWSVMLSSGRILVSYYFTLGDGPRHIAGTILEIGQSKAPLRLAPQ